MNFKNYFSNKNYIVLYVYSFLNKFSSALVNFFTGAFFLSLGMPLYFILLFFALEFGFRGIFSPLGPYFAKRFSIVKSMFISNIAYFLFFVFVSLSVFDLKIGFFAFIFHSFASGIYTTIYEGLESTLIKNENRGRQQSLIFILQSIAKLLGIIFGSFVLELFSYKIIVLVVGIFLITSSLSFLFLEKINFKENFSYKIIFLELFSSKYRENFLPIFGQALAIIANISFIPIYIYSKVGNFKSFGTILFFVFLIESLLIFFLGRILDKLDIKKINKKTAFLNGFSNFIFVIFAKTAFAITFLNTLNQISWNLYFNSALVRQYNKAKKKGFLFMTLIQMNLCFVEVIILSFFALIAFLFGGKVTYLIFAFSIIGLFLFSFFFKD